MSPDADATLRFISPTNTLTTSRHEFPRIPVSPSTMSHDVLGVLLLDCAVIRIRLSPFWDDTGTGE